MLATASYRRLPCCSKRASSRACVCVCLCAQAKLAAKYNIERPSRLLHDRAAPQEEEEEGRIGRHGGDDASRRASGPCERGKSS
eukprot:6202705-Pleurochrysis_carterae.AAC.1